MKNRMKGNLVGMLVSGAMLAAVSSMGFALSVDAAEDGICGRYKEYYATAAKVIPVGHRGFQPLDEYCNCDPIVNGDTSPWYNTYNSAC